MSIKSTTSACCTPKERPFPKLMQSTISGVIVLFTRPGYGTVVHGECNHGRKVGTHYEYWTESLFKDYEGSITLCNE